MSVFEILAWIVRAILWLDSFYFILILVMAAVIGIKKRPPSVRQSRAGYALCLSDRRPKRGGRDR